MFVEGWPCQTAYGKHLSFPLSFVDVHPHIEEGFTSRIGTCLFLFKLACNTENRKKLTVTWNLWCLTVWQESSTTVVRMICDAEEVNACLQTIFASNSDSDLEMEDERPKRWNSLQMEGPLSLFWNVMVGEKFFDHGKYSEWCVWENESCTCQLFWQKTGKWRGGAVR